MIQRYPMRYERTNIVNRFFGLYLATFNDRIGTSEDFIRGESPSNVRENASCRASDVAIDEVGVCSKSGNEWNSTTFMGDVLSHCS